MSDEQLIDELFLRVVELEPAARAHEFDQAGASAELRRRVEQLVGCDSRIPQGFLESAERVEPEIQSGARIGAYHIIERIGEGGMGTVYAARQSFPQREVALKVLQTGRVSEDAIRRFRHEIEILGRLQHSGIARIYDAGVAEAPDAHGVAREVPYFTMERVRGVPIIRHANEHGLGREQRLELLARVCDAVHYAHQRGVIHRDLKAENVLVTTDETTAGSEQQGDAHHESTREIGQPKVLDFGIARLVDPDAVNATRQTLDGALIGTLSSMSPEQVTGERQLVDVRSDVYALGVMLYELVCGRPPIALGGLTVPQAIRRITESDPAPLGDVDASLRGDLTTISLKALEKDAERRYQTAADLASDLRAFLAGAPIEARADSRMYLLQRSLRRHRLAVNVALAFAAVLGAFALISVKQADENAELAASESDARQLATADFERALGAVELLTELGSDRLVTIPQADGARRELLEAAAVFYRDLLAAHPDDRELDHRHALAHNRLAMIERDLGHFDVSIEHARQASEQFERQLSATSDGASLERLLAQRGLASALTLLGNLLYKAGELDAAELELRRAVSITRDLVEVADPDSNSHEHFASSHKHLAIVLTEMGEHEDALAQLVLAIETSEEMLARAPSPELQLELVALLQQISVLRLKLGQSELVEQDLLRAIELCEGRLADDPLHIKCRQDLAALRSNYSVALGRWKRHEEEASQLDLSIATSEGVLEEHPELDRTCMDLVGAYNNRATILMGRGDYAAADADMGRAARLLERLIEKHPSPLRTAKLATLENNQAAIQIYLGRLPEAIVTLASTLEHAELVLESMPERTDMQAVVRYATTNLATCHVNGGHYAEAVEVIREVRYPARGHVSAEEVAAVLHLWQNAMELADADEALSVTERADLTQDYVAGAKGYLESALLRGFDQVAALKAARNWTRLLDFPEFAELLDRTR